MKKEEILQYLKDNLTEYDYTYLVIDMRDWRENKPEIFEAWRSKDDTQT